MTIEINWAAAQQDPAIIEMLTKHYTKVNENKIRIDEYTQAIASRAVEQPHLNVAPKITYSRELIKRAMGETVAQIQEIIDTIDERCDELDSQIFKQFVDALEDPTDDFARAKEIDAERSKLMRNYSLSYSEYNDIAKGIRIINNAVSMLVKADEDDGQDLNVPLMTRLEKASRKGIVT
jgi:hypothetical protein